MKNFPTLIRRNPMIINKIENIIPWIFEISPEAIGLNFFEGWFLSEFISWISLYIYVAETIKEKPMNTLKTFIINSEEKEKFNKNGININKFLLHCHGLIKLK